MRASGVQASSSSASTSRFQGSSQLLHTAVKRARTSYCEMDKACPKRKQGWRIVTDIDEPERGHDTEGPGPRQIRQTVVGFQEQNSGKTPPYITTCRQNSPPRAGTPSASRILLYASLPQVPDLLEPATAFFVMDTLLSACAKVNFAFGTHDREGELIPWALQIEKNQCLLDRIVQLPLRDAVCALWKEITVIEGKGIQARYNQTVYWDIISKAAKTLDRATLPTSRGRLDDFTMAEKAATRTFMVAVGFGTSKSNQRSCRRFWKLLSDLRAAHVDKVLRYRTKEFDKFCRQHPDGAATSLMEIILSWEATYAPHAKVLEERARKEAEGDTSGRVWLHQPLVAGKLQVPETSWNCGENAWNSRAEEARFLASRWLTTPQDVYFGRMCGIEELRTSERNKAIFMTLLPSGEELLSVCPIVTVQKGDFLGVLGGNLRYSADFDSTYGIRGPHELLWLDYSCVTGLLNQMHVSLADRDANVQVRWETIRERRRKKQGLVWMASVRALRTIHPFERLVRVTSQEQQYSLHQQATHARAGFTGLNIQR